MNVTVVEKIIVMSPPEQSSELRRELVEFLPRLRRFTRSLARGSVEDGDDLAQATVERALGNLAKFEVGTRLDSWMYKMAQNIWIDKCRSEKVRGPQVSDALLAMMPGDDGRRVTEARLTLAKTRDAIERLPDAQRSAVMLVLVDGLSYQDAARALSIPVGTIMSRLNRARIHLEREVFG